MEHIFARKGDKIIGHDGKLYATVANDLSIHMGALRVQDFIFEGETPATGSVMSRVMWDWVGDRRRAFRAANPEEDAFTPRSVA